MDEKLSQIKQLFDQGLGSRLIAKQLNMTRWAVQQAYKKLGVYDIGRKKPFKEMSIEKICKTCSILKSISEFRSRINKNGRTYYEPYCKICEEQLNKNACKERYQTHPEKWKKYKKENLEHIREKDRIRWKTDIAFKIRNLFSHFIRQKLKENDAKKDSSFIKKISYSIDQLKTHLEKQFEPWMNWNNHGVYRRNTWDDNNPTTWTWQIDHIIPQSDLPYVSMGDDNFKKCWSLENLRPLNSKQNLLDGVSRKRHKV